MRKIVGFGLVILLAGCGTQPVGNPLPSSPSGRELITPEIRQACYWRSDVELAGTLHALQLGYENGDSELTALSGMIDGCASACAGDSDCLASCIGCVSACVERVWP